MNAKYVTVIHIGDLIKFRSDIRASPFGVRNCLSLYTIGLVIDIRQIVDHRHSSHGFESPIILWQNGTLSGPGHTKLLPRHRVNLSNNYFELVYRLTK